MIRSLVPYFSTQRWPRLRYCQGTVTVWGQPGNRWCAQKDQVSYLLIWMYFFLSHFPQAEAKGNEIYNACTSLPSIARCKQNSLSAMLNTCLHCCTSSLQHTAQHSLSHLAWLFALPRYFVSLDLREDIWFWTWPRFLFLPLTDRYLFLADSLTTLLWAVALSLSWHRAPAAQHTFTLQCVLVWIRVLN